MNSPWLRLFSWCVVLILLSSVSWLHFAGRIDLLTADLGRHLKNGELFFSDRLILATNFYSYTHPDFSAICHHWGIGPILFIIWKAIGFNGLSWVYTFILFATFALSILIAWRASFIGAAILFGVLALPLVGYRVEIRPEGVSTLFLMTEYLLLSQCRTGRVRAGWLWVIPAIQLVWVNVHVLFFAGLVLTGVYVIDALIRPASVGYRRQVTFIFGASLAALLMSPFAALVLFNPFTIFQGYGYTLVENQSVFFMMKRFPHNPLFVYFSALFVVGIALIITRMIIKRSWKDRFPQVVIYLLCGLMAIKSVRFISMFGFLFIPIMAEAVGVFVEGRRVWWKILLRQIVIATAIAVVFLAATMPYFYLSPVRKYTRVVTDTKYRNSLFFVLAHPDLWSGLVPGVKRSSEFFRMTGLKGPVFNNYDIGGYFIFTLFPQERPFVDNRPEAYPVDFFQRVYIPMQENENVWADVKERYKFELVYFYRHDMTPWAQSFLIRRLDDKEWAPIFVDDYTIIFARRNGINQPVIASYELPRAMFKTTVN